MVANGNKARDSVATPEYIIMRQLILCELNVPISWQSSLYLCRKLVYARVMQMLSVSRLQRLRRRLGCRWRLYCNPAGAEGRKDYWLPLTEYPAVPVQVRFSLTAPKGRVKTGQYSPGDRISCGKIKGTWPKGEIDEELPQDILRPDFIRFLQFIYVGGLTLIPIKITFGRRQRDRFYSGTLGYIRIGGGELDGSFVQWRVRCRVVCICS
ncbi:hypothetical protein J6590_075261 [Homalodisca vitripennis]|nr:hypothetical protein J6590_075261 [Homalodisca vitripennis]